MAGIEALASQNGGGRLGFINPTLYKVGKNPNLFNDVTGPVLTRATCGRTTSTAWTRPAASPTACARSTRTRASRSGPGWDDVTGFGSPTARYIKNFANKG